MKTVAEGMDYAQTIPADERCPSCRGQTVVTRFVRDEKPLAWVGLRTEVPRPPVVIPTEVVECPVCKGTGMRPIRRDPRKTGGGG